MPNYEYECKECAKRFEIWQNVGEAAPPCPSCASEVKKVFHPPRIIFKGSGFYVTDLRAEKDAGSAKKEKSEAAKSESTSDSTAKSETTTTSSDTATPAAKPEAATSTSSPTPAATSSAS